MSAMADTPRDAGYGIFRRWNPEIDERDSLTGSLAFLQQAEIRFPCTCCLECETLAGANHRTHLLDQFVDQPQTRHSPRFLEKCA